MASNGYQGWANWETWNVALWFGNDEGLYRAVLDYRGRFTADSAKAFVLEILPRGTPDFKRYGGSPRAVAKAYAEVDWREIAADFNEMKGEDEGGVEEARRAPRARFRGPAGRPVREGGEDEDVEVWIDAGDNEAPWLAQRWHSSQGDPLYALGSSGFPQPESTVSWALRNARESEDFQWKSVEKKYGKRKLRKLVDIDLDSHEARDLSDEEREDMEASHEISQLVWALQQALKHGERISREEGLRRHGHGPTTAWEARPHRAHESGGKPLISSQDTRKAEKIIRSAAAAKFGRGRADLFFEHGHWWATVGDRTYDVVDAIPGVDGLGIDFEALG